MQRGFLIAAAFLILTTTSVAEARRPSRAELRRASYGAPRILSRSEWGADESIGIAGDAKGESDERTAEKLKKAEPRSLSGKERKCRENALHFPKDFHVEVVDTHNRKGDRYVWPRRYSPQVKLLVLHHTGEVETGNEDNRTGIERVRAIYKWHAARNGWGDIGYHYLIDKEGVIYEGRAGGEKVIGAHVYCANVGTVSVSLIGNFHHRYPSEEQLRSARWLLSDLSQKYNLDPEGTVLYQGEEKPTILAHRDLGPSQCAGRTVQKLLPEIRRLTAARDFESSMLAEVRRKSREQIAQNRNALYPMGSTHLQLPPRGTARLQLRFTAGEKAVTEGSVIGKVMRSERSIGLWQQWNGRRQRIRTGIRTERDISKGGHALLQFTVLAPAERGSYVLRLGQTSYTLEVSGRGPRNRSR